MNKKNPFLPQKVMEQMSGDKTDVKLNQEIDRLNAQLRALENRIKTLEEESRNNRNRTPLVLEETDGAPSFPSVTKIQFDEAAGFSLSSPGAGIVVVTKTP